MRLNCESLETRENPSAVISYTYGYVNIVADAGGSDITLSGADQNSVTVKDNMTGIEQTFSDGFAVVFVGGIGNDKIVNNSGWPLNAKSNGGTDYFQGGRAKDTFTGGSGSTTFVEAFPSVDTLRGGTGTNTFISTGGADGIFTGPGYNFVYAPTITVPGLQTGINASQGYGTIFVGPGAFAVNVNPGFTVINL
jgi:Ca2+-binding RTX toxin-like protein